MEKVNRGRIKRFLRIFIGVTYVLLSLFPFVSNALSIINDEETETYLEKVIKPIFKAADIPFNRNQLFILDDQNLNAFVSDGNNMFVYTGTLLAVENTNELTGILAHETGHIKGGHILRQKLKIQDLQKLGLASAILAGAAGVASGRADVTAAILLGGNSSALTNFSAHRIEEERNADEAAVNILKKLKQSPAGMLRFMKKISRTNKLQGVEETPYFRTHPMTNERISFLENAVKNSNFDEKSPLDSKLIRIQAKLSGFLLPAEDVRRKYKNPTAKIEDAYADAIADLREFQYEKAQKKIDFLLQKEPENPYFWELKGQMLFEEGKISEARKAFEKSLKIMPDSALFKYNLAQAIIEDEHSSADLIYNEKILNQALNKFSSSFGWLLLARTYDELGKSAEKYYASAKYSFEIGEPLTAKKQLEEAKKSNKNDKFLLKIDDFEREIDDFLHKNN